MYETTTSYVQAQLTRNRAFQARVISVVSFVAEEVLAETVSNPVTETERLRQVLASQVRRSVSPADAADQISRSFILAAATTRLADNSFLSLNSSDTEYLQVIRASWNAVAGVNQTTE